MIKLCASYRTLEEKELLLKELEGMEHLHISRWPKKEYRGKGKSSGTKIYLELTAE